jgi:DNA-binding XRE family transcriptional regulator
MKTLEDILKDIPARRRKKIEARAAQIIAEEMTLQQLRKAQQCTQARLAKDLGMTQDQVSRLEQRSDILLSTLRKYVEGMGGHLSIIAEFPDQKPVSVASIAMSEPPPRKSRKHTHA